MNECTTIDTPFCLYDADRNKDTKSFKGPGVLVCSIDNMPTQLPKEATDFFGNLLYPYALDIIQSDAKKPLEEHNFSSAVNDAIIASNGRLTPDYEYIQGLRQLYQRSKHKADNRETQSKTVKRSSARDVKRPVIRLRYLTHRCYGVDRWPFSARDTSPHPWSSICTEMEI